MTHPSILITYYNEKELLTQCLESLANQTTAVGEILVYDDCSRFPAKDYLPPGLKVEVIRGETNRGPSHGRNELLKQAKGSLVHFHDSDDLFKPQWCERVMSEMTAYDPDVVFTEIESYYGSQMPSPSTLAAPKVLRLEKVEAGGLLHYVLTGYMLVPSGTYKKELLEDLGGYAVKMFQAEDFHFHVRMALKKPKFRLIHESLVQIRLRTESRSQNRKETFGSTLDALEDLAPQIPKEHLIDCAEFAARSASYLFEAGDHEKAKHGFTLARKWGPPFYVEKSPLYRVVARLFSPVLAEYIGVIYRGILPASFRRLLRPDA